MFNNSSLLQETLFYTTLLNEVLENPEFHLELSL